MRSFAVIAGFAAAANAYAYGYPEAYNTTSVAAPAYETSKAAEYPAYPVASSSAAAYPAYPAESSKAPAYAVSSAAPVYSAYTTTKVVTGLTTVCPEPTTVTYGSKTYTVSKSTTLIDDDCEYTTTEVVKPTPAPVKPTGTGYTPAHPSAVVPGHPAPYPSAPAPAANGTAVYPTGVKPSSTKPATPEFTGAAAQAGVGLLAIVGAVAAFL